jgi:hypothetical protein
LTAGYLVKVGINIADKASRHTSAWLLAIQWGQNGNHQRSIQTVVCSTAGYWWWRNGTCQQSIQILFCSTAGYLWRTEYSNLKIRKKYAWLHAIVESKIEFFNKASWHSSAQLLAIGEGRNGNCRQSFRTLICLTAGYSARKEWILPMKHLDTLVHLSAGYLVRKKWTLPSGHSSAWLLAIGTGMKLGKEASKHLSAWLLAIGIGMKITDKASEHSSAQLPAFCEGMNENCQQSIWTLVCLTAGYW